MTTATFTCPACGRTSHHPDDARYGYCGACHEFTGSIRGWTDRRHIHMLIDDERRRQEAKFPNRTCADPLPPELKVAVLVEEVGEVARAVLEHEPADRLRDELVQVAAVAVAWLEALQRADR